MMAQPAALDAARLRTAVLHGLVSRAPALHGQKGPLWLKNAEGREARITSRPVLANFGINGACAAEFASVDLRAARLDRVFPFLDFAAHELRHELARAAVRRRNGHAHRFQALADGWRVDGFVHGGVELLDDVGRSALRQEDGAPSIG